MENTIALLNEIASGATIRFTVIDGVQYLSTVDFIMHICDTTNDYAGQIWRNLSESTKNEIYDFAQKDIASRIGGDKKPFVLYQFPGRGQRNQLVITFPAALKLAMMLPGKNAARYKSKCADLISRYLDGDASICSEVKENNSIGQKRSYSRFIGDITARVEVDKANEMYEPQYIYATKSAAFPGLIKIGCTSNMKARLSQLNTACAPSPHEVVSIAPSMDMHRDECLAHENFASKRKAGEFFELDESDVKKYFERVILHRYQRELLVSVQSRN
jgi:hypothetical protein